MTDSYKAGERTIGFFFLSGRGEEFRKRHSFYMRLYHCIEKSCRQKKYRVLYLTVSDLNDFICLTKRYRFFGALFMGKIPQDIVHYAREKQIPAITVNEKFFGIPCLTMDNVRGGYIATKYLLDNGHRMIKFITGPQNYFTSEDRLLGAVKALEERGLPIERDDILTGDWSFQSGYAAMEQILDAPETQRPTAVFAFNEDMALGVVKALNDRELNVPEDMSIIGFDGTFSDRYLTEFTTVDGSIWLMAETAAVTLVNQINGCGLGYGVTILLPVQLKEAGSVMPILNQDYAERGSVKYAVHTVEALVGAAANK